jgi:hypothetical protein
MRITNLFSIFECANSLSLSSELRPMIHNAYQYDQTKTSSYRFTSVGSKQITKEVIFIHTGYRNIVNLGFGDVLPDGSVDDKANSNNGDIVRVLGTIVQIMIDFTGKFPDLEIFFAGSTPERSKLYLRIIRAHYHKFSKIFVINILEPNRNGFIERPFASEPTPIFIGFLIKRIH